MKYKFLGGTALFLSAAMLLTACGASGNVTDTASQTDTAVQAVTEQTNTVQTDTTDPAGQTDTQDSTSASGAVQMDVDLNGTKAAAVFADVFSSRDLSGAYDAAAAIPIVLNGAGISSVSSAVQVSGSTATITAAGTYLLSGILENGTIIVDAGKGDKVQLVLNGVTIQSDTFAAIYVRQADKVFVTLADSTVNTLSNGGAFTAIDDNSVDGVIFSKDDLTLNGTGKLVIPSSGKHGVVSKDDLVITGGAYEITVSSHALSGKDSVSVADGTFTLTAGKDGIHAENSDDAEKGNVYLADGTMTIQAGSDGVSASGLLQVDGGTYSINGSEGIEGTYVRVNDGTIDIYATDDGINAARKSSAYTPTVEINGGELTVEVGPGDTDGIDSNGNLIITGGTIRVTGNSTFDIDGSITFTGGTVYVNGTQVDTIPRQMMGGRGGMGAMGGRGGMGRNFGTAPDGTAPGSRQFPDGTTPDGTAPSGRQLPDGTTDGAPRQRGGKNRIPGAAADGGTGSAADGNTDSSTSGGTTDGTVIPGSRGGRGQMSGTGKLPRNGERPDAVTSPTQTVSAQNRQNV